MNGTSRSLRQVYSYSDSEIVQKWAIIVGISKYKDESLNLKFADRDAEELYKLLLSPIGGGFEEDHIKKLVNEEATTAEITKALRSFVKKAGKDDIYMLYFACHGSPDMDRLNSNIIYLLTHDTDPNDISGTALRMDEIDRSLKDYMNAERVVIIADTCHSAAIGGGIGRRGACNRANAINVYLQEVSKAKGGVALLTSAEANESSLEGDQWGDGHGVFTHFLLQGMRGDADGYGQPKDGIVTVGELFDYVIDKVRKETNHQQHPSKGTDSFDRNLPMAVTGEVNVLEYYKLGLGLYELGWMLDDTKRFQAAAEQFREAISLSRMVKAHHPEAELGLGKALAASGDHEEAIRVLSGLIDRNRTESSSEALFYLGITQAKKRDYPAAESTFEKFLSCYPENENISWVKEYTEWLKRKNSGKKYALLIGINEYPLQKTVHNQAGCLNDVTFMKKVLTQRYGFEKTNMITLLDKDATCQGILSAFESLSQKVTTEDTVIVHYSGFSITEKDLENKEGKFDQDLYLFAHDTTDNLGFLSNGISPSELHMHMNAIPAVNKTLILDTNSSSRFIELAEKEGSYTLLLATDSAGFCFEHSMEIESGNVTMGLFTYVLTRLFEEPNTETLTYGELLDTAITKIRALGNEQTPLLIGDPKQLAFVCEDVYLKLFEFAQRRNYTSMELENINKLYEKYRKHTANQPALTYYSFGRAFLEKNNYNAAIEALQIALQHCNSNHHETIFLLGKAHVGARDYSKALENFQKYAVVVPEEMATLARQLIERTEKLVSCRKHALLVGINDYLDPSVTPVKGAVNDVQALKEVLLTKFGFKEKDITVLHNSDATRAAIIDAFKQLVEKARGEPAIFYFAGNGSFNIPDHEPTIVSADGRLEMVYDIEIKELAELASSNAPNLITIIDAGWIGYQGDKDRRTVQPDFRERHAARNIKPSQYRKPLKLDQDKLRIGFLSIYAHSIRDSSSSLFNKSESKFKVTKPGLKGKFFGILTQGLIQSLEEVNTETLTYSQWLVSVSEQIRPLEPVVFGDPSNELVFDSRTMRNEVLKLVNKIEQESVFESIMLLRRMIERHEQHGNSYPEGWLNLGVAFSAVGEYDKSIQALGRAVDLCTDHHEAHYQLGRVLFESGHDFVRSVSELDNATKLDPENVRAYYYLGQAIRVMVERETLAKAEQALKTYLEKGAPLGHGDEIRKFLKSRIEGTLKEREVGI